jgi:hypothetical protein
MFDSLGWYDCLSVFLFAFHSANGLAENENNFMNILNLRIESISNIYLFDNFLR